MVSLDNKIFNMELKIAQQEAEKRRKTLKIKKPKPLEIVAALAEELGEVVTEVALFEKIGNKINWKRKADKNLLAREISQLLVNLLSLASHYKIDVDKAYDDLIKDKEV